MSVDRTKRKILEVASKLFNRYGFNKTSMDEIAKIARKAKGSLYYHFTNKENLFREVVAGEIKKLKSELRIVVGLDLDAKEKLKAYLLKRMSVLNYSANYHETLKADFFEHYDFIDDLREDLDIWEKTQITQILNEGMSSGLFIEIKQGEAMNAILDTFIMVIKGLEIPFFIQNKYKSLEPYFNDMIGILIRGISK